MPAATKLIDEVLSEGNTYRLLSGMAHGHSWALSRGSFEVTGADEDTVTLEKHLSPLAAVYLCTKCTYALGRPFWHKCILFGWNESALAGIFDRACGSLPDGAAVSRFWGAPQRQPT